VGNKKEKIEGQRLSLQPARTITGVAIQARPWLSFRARPLASVRSGTAVTRFQGAEILTFHISLPLVTTDLALTHKFKLLLLVFDLSFIKECLLLSSYRALANKSSKLASIVHFSSYSCIRTYKTQNKCTIKSSWSCNFKAFSFNVRLDIFMYSLCSSYLYNSLKWA
jgi:hypothetical protein